ncbi:hypothetical protein AGMMS50218_00750 [Actinomycetota bacterium]|nr:hypothetical protein AGMMS50218_00750 [Actinomycetota bacterium]
MASVVDDRLAGLPDTFRYVEAMKYVSERRLRSLVAEGQITALSRGLYRKSDWLGDDDLIEIASRSPHATLCLRSALVKHDLVDDVQAVIDVAVPRGAWTSRTRSPVSWRHFDPDTFEIGRGRLDIGAGRSVGLYSAERSIVDAFRLRHLDGADVANEALKRWLRRGGQPATLLRLAREFPRTVATLRRTLEILL